MAGLLDIQAQLSGRDPRLQWINSVSDRMMPLDDPYTYNALPPSLPGAEVKSRPDTVWPSHAFWERIGISDPQWHARMGQAQAGLLGALDLFGIPGAIASRVLPEEMIAQPREMMQEHGKAAMAGGMLAGVAGPLRGAYRAAGDALGSRGFGIGTQMAADAGSAAGLMTAGDMVRGEQPNGDVARGVGGAAAALRWMAPGGLPGVMTRTAMGAGAGAANAFPQAISGQYDDALASTATGAALGASMRGTPGTRVNPTMDQAAMTRLGLFGGTGLLQMPWLLNAIPTNTDAYDQSAQARYPFGGY